MSKYHMSSNGTLEPCGATRRACPLGGQHFSARAVARINAGIPASSKERSAWLNLKFNERTEQAKQNLRRIDNDITNNFDTALKASKANIEELLNMQDRLEQYSNPTSNNAATVAKANAALAELNPKIEAKLKDQQKLIDEADEFLNNRNYRNY